MLTLGALGLGLDVRPVAVRIDLGPLDLRADDHLGLLEVRLGADLCGLYLRRRRRLLGVDLGLFFLGVIERRRVEPARLQILVHCLLRILAEDRVRRHADDLRQLHGLCVALDQSAAAPGFDEHIALRLGVVTKQHQPVVVALDVRLRHAGVEQARYATQHGVGVVVEHLQAADGIRRRALLALQQHRQPGAVLGHLHAQLNDVGQLYLQHRDDDRFDLRLCGPVVVVVLIAHEDFPWLDLPDVVLRADAAAEHEHRTGTESGVVHQVARRCGHHALGGAHLARNTDASPVPGAPLPAHHVVGELAAVDRVQSGAHNVVVDHRDQRLERSTLTLGALAPGGLDVVAADGAVEIPDLELALGLGDLSVIINLAAGRIFRRAFFEHSGQLVVEIPGKTLERRHALLAQRIDLPDPRPVVDVLTARGVRIQVPVADVLGGRDDLLDDDQLEVAAG